jgi:hypothetical protein
MELVRAIGGISWVVGLFTLLISPTFGLLIIGVAALLTVWSVSKTREQRHQELVRSVREGSGKPV